MISNLPPLHEALVPPRQVREWRRAENRGDIPNLSSCTISLHSGLNQKKLAPWCWAVLGLKP